MARTTGVYFVQTKSKNMNMFDLLLQVVLRDQNGHIIHPVYAIAPLIIAGIIAAAGSIISSIVKSKGDSNANQQQLEYNQAMYGQQRSDALADWNMQNDYNSPTSQMARLRQAGLNPILAAGNISSSSPSVRSVSAESYNPRTTDISSGLGGAFNAASSTLMDSYDVKMKEAQTDNLKAQNTVIANDAVLKAAQVAAIKAQASKTDIDTQSALFSLTQNQRLADTNAEMASANLNATLQKIDIAGQQNERDAASNAQSLQEGAQRILNLKLDAAQKNASTRLTEAQIAQAHAALDNAIKDGRMKDFENEMAKQHIFKGDSMWARMLQIFIDKLMKTSLPGKIWDGIGNLKIN